MKKGTYRHFKGMLVEVTGTALHSETMEEMVIYSHSDPVKGQGADTAWVRPLKMFQEEVEVEGKMVPRFAFMKEAD